MDSQIEENKELNSFIAKDKAKASDAAKLIEGFCNLVSQKYNNSHFWSEYLKDRCLWYTKKAERNKLAYHVFTILATILPLIVTLITSIDGLNNWRKWVSAILSILVAICSFLVGHFRYLEHWTNYRSAIESILREMNQFASKAGTYKEVEDDVAVQLFAERIDVYIGDEQAKWCEKQHSIDRNKTTNA